MKMKCKIDESVVSVGVCECGYRCITGSRVDTTRVMAAHMMAAHQDRHKAHLLRQAAHRREKQLMTS